LFTYVTLHSANHALGNISIDAMESGLAIQKAIWQSTPGAITLHAALTIHMCLGFWALYERRHFRWSWMEAMQLALGLTIPFLLTDHVLGRRVSLSLFGTEKGYAEVLLKLWVRDPLGHPAVDPAACRPDSRPHWHSSVAASEAALSPRQGTLLSIAVLLPTLALLGYY
jgi:adenylate cyclase